MVISVTPECGCKPLGVKLGSARWNHPVNNHQELRKSGIKPRIERKNRSDAKDYRTLKKEQFR